MDFLGQPGNGSVELSGYILQEYRKQKNKPLKITQDSLTIEILAHAYLDQIAGALIVLGKTGNEVIKKALNAMQEIKNHTDIIDCGELEVDSNRHIWDSLVPYHAMIYMACGKRA